MLIKTLPKETRNFRKQAAGEATYSVSVIGNEKTFKSKHMVLQKDKPKPWQVKSYSLEESKLLN